MRKYNIKVINGTGAIVYDDVIIAIDENSALIEMLSDNTIYSDDTIEISEI